MTEMVPVAYLSGMYREFIEGKRERVPLGVEVSLVNLNWPQQIPLVRLSDAEARIKELERERDVWKANSGGIAVQPVLDSLHAAEARAEAAEALLKEALEVLDSYADPTGYIDGYGEAMEADAPIHPGLLAKATADKLRTALAISAKIGGKG